MHKHHRENEYAHEHAEHCQVHHHGPCTCTKAHNEYAHPRIPANVAGMKMKEQKSKANMWDM